MEGEPKELTCKGGLLCSNFSEDIENIKTVLVGDQKQTVITDPAANSDSGIKYKGLMGQKQLLDEVVSEVTQFIEKFFEWHKKINYTNKFGASPKDFSALNSKMKEDLYSLLVAGIKEKQLDIKNNEDINLEETLFFYPLKGTINRLAKYISSIS